MLVQLLSNRFGALKPFLEEPNTHIVLLQSGVYILPQLLNMPQPLRQSVMARISVLDTDAQASGLASLVRNHQNMIGTEQWVALCAQHDKVLTLQ